MFTRSFSILSGLALLAASVAPSLKADEWNKKTVFTIDQPVQLPNKLLEPGTYVFKLLDSLSDRHIVQVFTSDERQLITTILAIPNYRLQGTDKTKFQFWETPVGQPQALRAWFYPGDNFGQEFAYPKTLSTQIAKSVNSPVPTLIAERESELKTATLVTVDDKGNELPVNNENILVVKNDVPATPFPESAAASTAMSTSANPKTLPSTASSYPLVGLIGLVLMASAGLMSRVSHRA